MLIQAKLLKNILTRAGYTCTAYRCTTPGNTRFTPPNTTYTCLISKTKFEKNSENNKSGLPPSFSFIHEMNIFYQLLLILLTNYFVCVVYHLFAHWQNSKPNMKRRIQSMKNYVLLLLTAICVTAKFDPLIAELKSVTVKFEPLETMYHCSNA